jgi:hypothetical protein
MNKRVIILLSLACIFILACQSSAWPFLAQPTPTLTPSRTPTARVTPTSTQPEIQQSSCGSRDELIRKIKSSIDYDESVLSYNYIDHKWVLYFWIVDPNLDPGAALDTLSPNNDRAVRDATLLIVKLVNADACAQKLFSVVDPIVVDSAYNGWFSGEITIDSVFQGGNPSDDDLQKMIREYVGSYHRTQAPTKLGSHPLGSCSWQQVVQRLYERQFAPTREKVKFYFIRDETGAKVWAQWDQPPFDPKDKLSQGIMMASAMNVMVELKCLYPAPEWLVIVVVDDQGSVNLVGRIPRAAIYKIDISQLDILYP